MLRIRRISVLSAAIAGLAFANGLHAAVVASDVASNSPYTAGTADNATTEFNGDNGGSGFGPWAVVDTENYTGTTPPPTTDNGPGNGNGEGFINSAAASGDTHNPGPGYFDVYDNGNPGSSSSTGAALGSSIETAMRPFNTPLTGSGSSFSFIETLASLRAANAGSPTSQVGFELLDSSGNVLMDLFCNGGGAGFLVTDAVNNGFQLISTDAGRNPQRALTINSNSGDTITITLNGQDATNPNNYDYTISSAGHEGSTFADNLQINMSTGGPAAFEIFNNDGGFGSDIRVNSLTENVTLVPEPTSIALGGMGVSALLLRRRRR
jgi:hypothetical protein